MQDKSSSDEDMFHTPDEDYTGSANGRSGDLSESSLSEVVAKLEVAEVSISGLLPCQLMC